MAEAHHAGIATQAVEKRLLELELDGKTRHDIG
jgi:hypothetical protein